MSDWFQWAIIAFVVVSIARHVWRIGAANPESTGTLDRKVNGLSGDVKALGGRVGHLEADVNELKQEMATEKDVARIEERINTVRAEIEGHRNLSQATNDSVRRIERVIIEKGLGK